jgi:hypothetical protein
LLGFVGFEGQCRLKDATGLRSDLDRNVRAFFLTRQIASQSRQCVSRLHLRLSLRGELYSFFVRIDLAIVSDVEELSDHHEQTGIPWACWRKLMASCVRRYSNVED